MDVVMVLNLAAFYTIQHNTTRTTECHQHARRLNTPFAPRFHGATSCVHVACQYLTPYLILVVEERHYVKVQLDDLLTDGGSLHDHTGRHERKQR